MEDNLNFFNMEDDLNCQIEDNLIFCETGRWTNFFNTDGDLNLKMEDNLIFSKQKITTICRWKRPYFFKKWNTTSIFFENGRQSKFFWNGRRPQFFWKYGRWPQFFWKWKTTLILSTERQPDSIHFEDDLKVCSNWKTT